MVNKVILVGNVGNEPDVKKVGETTIANFSLATSEKYKGEDRTEWHRITAFNRLAEIIDQYLKKGTKVYIEGKIQTRSFEDSNGVTRYVTEIIANNMQMLSSKSEAVASNPLM